MENLLSKIVFNSLVFILGSNFVQAGINIPVEPIPGSGNKPITLLELQSLVSSIGNFLIVTGPILFVISLVMSGIWYMKAGADPGAVAKAKSWFWYSVLGGLIVFGSGVIVNTVAGIVTREFFCRVGFSIGSGISVCIFN